MDGDDYTYEAVLVPHVRTADQKILDEIADLRLEVATLASAFATLIRILDVRPTTATGGLPGGKSAVLITRQRGVIESRHVFVYHQVLHDAPEALRLMQDGNWVFVQPSAVGPVLDALGVQAR